MKSVSPFDHVLNSPRPVLAWAGQILRWFAAQEVARRSREVGPRARS